MQAMAFFTPKNSLFLAMIFVCVAQVAPLVPIYRIMGHMYFVWAQGFVCPFDMSMWASPSSSSSHRHMPLYVGQLK